MNLFGLPVCHVNHSVPPVSEKDTRTNAIYSQSSLISSESASRESSSESKSSLQSEWDGSILVRQKKCEGCNEEKPYSEYYRNSKGRFQSFCKSCCQEKERLRKRMVPAAKLRSNFSDYRKKKRGAILFNQAKNRAKMKGLSFTLTESDKMRIQKQIWDGRCEVTGLPFNLEGGKTWDSPSLDRIDNSKGYEPGNVRVVLYCVNVMSNTWGPNKIIEISKAIMAQRRIASEIFSDKLTECLKRRINLDASPEYEMHWSQKVTPSGLRYYQLAASARRTSGRDCSGWRSPCERDHHPSKLSGNPDRQKQVQLAHEAQMAGLPTPNCDDPNNATRDSGQYQSLTRTAGWTTPQAHDSSPRGKGQKAKHGTKHGCADLNADAQLSGWYTPKSTDGSKGGPNQSGGSLPNDASKAGWATCSSRDWKDTPGMAQEGFETSGKYRNRIDQLPRQAMHLTPGLTASGSPAQTGSGGGQVLNAIFVSFLMGYPKSWVLAGYLSSLKSKRKS